MTAANIQKPVSFSVLVMRRLTRRFRVLLLAVRLATWVIIISIFAKLVSLPRALKMISPDTLSASPHKINAATDKSLHQMVRILDKLLKINRFVFTPTCWKRAALIYRYLAKAGIKARIVFGVRSENDGHLAGHAWVEVAGQPIYEATSPDYTRTYIYPVDDKR